MSKSSQKEASNQNDIPQLSADTNEVEPGRQFLSQVANSVWELVKVPKHKARFLEQAKKFQTLTNRVRQFLKWRVQRAETDPTLKKHKRSRAQRYGLEWDGFFRMWRPPLPFNPEEWLDGHYANIFPPKLSKLQSKPREPNSSDERLMCQYVLLGIIYDNVRAVLRHNRLCGVLDEDFLHLFWQGLVEVFTEEKSRQEARAKVDEALHDVEADLASPKQPGSEKLTELAGAEQPKSKLAVTKDEVNLVVTLDDFMRDYCDLKGHDIASKRELICKMNRQRRITLPPRPQGAGEWKSGQRFVFYAHDLAANWDAYRKVMPTLPLLKARKSAT